MKRFAALLAAVMMTLSCAAPLLGPAYADELPRVIDRAEILSLAEIESLEEDSAAFRETYGIDFVFVTVPSYDYFGYGSELADIAEEIYSAEAYGDETDGSAAFAVWCSDVEELELKLFGGAEEKISDDYVRFVLERAPGYYDEYGDWGPLYASIRFCQNYLDDHKDDPAPVPTADPAEPQQGQSTAAAVTGGKPDWYPEDPAHFQFFSNGNASRVVDVADIFSDEEEAKIEARCWEIIDKTGKDVVVFTDVSSYGLEQNVYCADFYDFNGYGFGDEREGLCLLFCMDPDDRGFMTVATGSQTRALFTQQNSNLMDDILYEHAVKAEYAEGVLAWQDTVETLYTKGTPIAPEWLPEIGESYTRVHRSEDPNAPLGYVDDQAGFFYPEEIPEIEAAAAQVADQYGIDIMIHTLRTPTGMDSNEYAEKYYFYNGIGRGNGYDGILLVMYPYDYSVIYAEGTAGEKLTDVNLGRMAGHIYPLTDENDYKEAALTFIEDTAHMMKTGRVARSLASWLSTGVLGSVFGTIFGGASLGTAKRTMKTPRTRTDASDYVRGFRLTEHNDNYLFTSTSRRYIPPQRTSSGGGHSSGGHSSYSSSFHSSSGASHSSSGRKF
ncbi:MAG: TPM domain-containing protein [Firmicutes bacterium]|nr:TPM domain-containing protein [Bacillota bacterium]